MTMKIGTKARAGEPPALPGEWQTALKQAISDPAELFAALDLSPPANFVTNPFTLRVPRSFVARMQKGDINDPLLRQVLPMTEELSVMPGYSHDPLQEQAVNPVPGLLHKFRGRVLLVVAGGCAVHCRYCFRRHFPYAEQALTIERIQQIIHYIAADPSIHEVIYSGGDPLLAKDKALAELTQKIAYIAHVRRLRIHTRLPIVIPERITDDLLHWLTATHLKPVMVLHCNHANEIDASVIQAVQRLRMQNITVLNQAVLLKGVNDTVESLVKLSEALFAAGILPYYLHILDKVQGAQHFAVSEVVAKQLIRQVTNQLPGYLVPKLVRELPGYAAKQVCAA